MKFWYCRFLCLCLGFLLGTPIHADTLRIGSWDRGTDMLVRGSEAILLKAYAELQQPVEFVEYPVRRALQMMLNGELDGNVFRIAELAAEQPLVYRVETPVNATEARVYALKPGFQPNSWAELAGLKVAYLRGTLLVERHLPATSVPLPASSQREIFKMLQSGLVDVAVLSEPAQGLPHTLAAEAGVRRLDAVLERTFLHHYLLASQRDVGERLNQVLKRMEARGELQAIRMKTLENKAK